MGFLLSGCSNNTIDLQDKISCSDQCKEYFTSEEKEAAKQVGGASIDNEECAYNKEFNTCLASYSHTIVMNKITYYIVDVIGGPKGKILYQYTESDYEPTKNYQEQFCKNNETCVSSMEDYLKNKKNLLRE